MLKSGAEQPPAHLASESVAGRRCIKSRGDFIPALQIFSGPESCLDAVGNVDFLKDII
jgi:hypothetical protein